MSNNRICIKPDNRNQEINMRYINRQQSDYNLQPHLSFYPVSTKFSVLPIIDKNTQPNVCLPNYKLHNTSNFYPGTSKPHFSGYSRNVNVESVLRNQFFALQSNPRAIYVPKSTSDLYNEHNYNNNNESIPYKDLYNTPQFDYFNPNTYNIAQQVFHNSTRTQLIDTAGKCNETSNDKIQ